MKFVVAVTNNRWFEFLRRQTFDEANFWSPGTASVNLDVGTPWLFKLHAPLNYVVGGGYFTYRTTLPLRVAWDTFGQENGAVDSLEFQDRIGKMHARDVIGCTVLSEPFFWDESQWLPPPPGWSQNIVSYKANDTASADVAEYWSLVARQLPRTALTAPDVSTAYGKPMIRLSRLGQGEFRSRIIDAYGRRCAVTGERTLPALEAAHIVPFSEIKGHDIRNGVLLRADLHRLFDDGYVTINPEHRFEVSKHIKDDYENGRDYYALHGRSIALPADPRLIPASEYLTEHATHIYRG